MFSGVVRLAVLTGALVAAGGAPAGAQAEPRPFAASSFWNQPIPAATRPDRDSRRLVSELVRQVRTHGQWLTTNSYTAPVYTVGAQQRRVPVLLDKLGYEGLATALLQGVPLPADARGSEGTDGAVVVWQPSTDTIWELWRLRRGPLGTFHAAWGGIIERASSSPGVFPRPFGLSASGLSVLGGLLRPGEMRAGRIGHAVSIGVPEVTAGIFRAPATRTDGRVEGGGLPLGTRFQLDPRLDIGRLGLSRTARVLARAAQRYGIVVRETTGKAVVFYGEDPLTMPADPWPEILGSESPTLYLAGFPWRRLRALPPTR